MPTAKHGAIVLEVGEYTVRTGPKGKGFEVYRTGTTASTRVASIGYDGAKGIEYAKREIVRRLGRDPFIPGKVG